MGKGIHAQGVRISKATGKPVKKYTKRDTAYWNGPTVSESKPIEPVEIHAKAKSTLDESNTGFLTASDRHADEAPSVLGKNFFSNAIYMAKKKPVDNLVVGLIGDMIGGNHSRRKCNSRTASR